MNTSTSSTSWFECSSRSDVYWIIRWSDATERCERDFSSTSESSASGLYIYATLRHMPNGFFQPRALCSRNSGSHNRYPFVLIDSGVFKTGNVLFICSAKNGERRYCVENENLFVNLIWLVFNWFSMRSYDGKRECVQDSTCENTNKRAWTSCLEDKNLQFLLLEFVCVRFLCLEKQVWIISCSTFQRNDWLSFISVWQPLQKMRNSKRSRRYKLVKTRVCPIDIFHHREHLFLFCSFLVRTTLVIFYIDANICFLLDIDCFRKQTKQFNRSFCEISGKSLFLIRRRLLVNESRVVFSSFLISVRFVLSPNCFVFLWLWWCKL